jgi:hypothetical protein
MYKTSLRLQGYYMHNGMPIKALPQIHPPALGEAGSSSMHAAQYAASQQRPLPLHRTSPGSNEDVAMQEATQLQLQLPNAPEMLQQYLRDHPEEAQRIMMNMFNKKTG